MNKLLVIANLYHASPRIPGIMTYLKDWEVSIITVPVGNDNDKLGFPIEFKNKVGIIYVNNPGDYFELFRAFLKRFGIKDTISFTEQLKQRARKTKQRTLIDSCVHWMHTILAYPDTETRWINPVYEQACRGLDIRKENNRQFDVILSSSPHPTSHIIASKLSKKYNIPWVAEFRDPWTENHNYTHFWLRRFFEKILEKKTIKPAKRLIAVTPLSVERLQRTHTQPIDLIYNGFDPANINKDKPPQGKFNLTYTGLIYLGKQNPDILLRALRNLVVKKLIDPDKIEVNFYGQYLNFIEVKSQEYGLDFVKQHGMLSRKEAWQKQRDAHALLLFAWEDVTQRGVHPSKLFEYMIANRPVLAMGGHSGDHIEQKINDTNIGFYCPKIDAVEAVITAMYIQHYLKGGIKYQPNYKEIMQYSYETLAEQMNNTLKKVLDKYG